MWISSQFGDAQWMFTTVDRTGRKRCPIPTTISTKTVERRRSATALPVSTFVTIACDFASLNRNGVAGRSDASRVAAILRFGSFGASTWNQLPSTDATRRLGRAQNLHDQILGVRNAFVLI